MVKNLFLRDAKGKRHFLVVLDKDKRADLKALQEQLSCSKLSFASEERLKKHLGLSRGSVTPLGILNDAQGMVELVFDRISLAGGGSESIPMRTRRPFGFPLTI